VKKWRNKNYLWSFGSFNPKSNHSITPYHQVKIKILVHWIHTKWKERGEQGQGVENKREKKGKGRGDWKEKKNGLGLA
jgi:hypothetical protein